MGAGLGTPSWSPTCVGPRRRCAIGRVVDELCRVYGFENLYVVDASAIPSIPRAPVNLTTIALAERAAE